MYLSIKRRVNLVLFAALVTSLGHQPWSPALAAVLAAVVPDGWLTGRERDVLNGLLTGKSNKEIAMSYGLSEVTIKHHLKNLRSKLGARNRTHAVCRAIELGLADDTSLSA